MTSYRRNFVPGGSYFFTVNIADRRSRLLTENIPVLRAAIRDVKARHPFAVDAAVVLPDHLHAIWTLPEGAADFALRWRMIKSAFSRAPPRTGVDQPPRQGRTRTLAAALLGAYATRRRHFNPVKHGHVGRVKDWPYSSFHRMVCLGVYPVDWGGDTWGEAAGFGER